MTEPAVLLKLLVLKTRQTDKLVAFYRSLGITFNEEQHGKGPVHYAANMGGMVLEIYPLPDDTGTTDQTTRLGFAVANLVQVVEDLQTSGTIVTRPLHQGPWGHRAVVQDPDGRAIELYQR
ncbi:hypothetical protein AYO44_13805 [Planctomycetaceae bacterium SCGC AG-212-F19]|nr:hypothetical protein AYO44_13805 [Planctomycetaceae bacterium SCGC AG-212-F19]